MLIFPAHAQNLRIFSILFGFLVLFVKKKYISFGHKSGIGRMKLKK